MFREIFNVNINFYVLAIVPITLAALFVCFYPYIINFLGYNGILCSIPNGFLFPLAIKFAQIKNEKKNYLEKTLIIFLFVLITLLSIASFVYILYTDINRK